MRLHSAMPAQVGLHSNAPHPNPHAEAGGLTRTQVVLCRKVGCVRLHAAAHSTPADHLMPVMVANPHPHPRRLVDLGNFCGYTPLHRPPCCTPRTPFTTC